MIRVWFLQCFLPIQLVFGRNCQCRSKVPVNRVGEGERVGQTTILGAATGPARIHLPGKEVSGETKDIPTEPFVEIFAKTKNLEIINSCSFEVLLGVTGSDKSTLSTSTSPGGLECPENQIHNGNGHCFWYMEGLPESLKSGEKWVFSLESDDDHLFSGNVWGVKRGKMEKSCPSGVCHAWVGPRGAITKAEFTLSKSGTDYYDVSIIEGANIPMAMYPLGLVTNDKDRYDCGIAGGCLWKFDPQANLRKFVTQVELLSTTPGKSCDETSDCEVGERCGSVFDSVPPNYGVCGAFNGYVSAHANCLTGSNGSPFFCKENANVISWVITTSQATIKHRGRRCVVAWIGSCSE